MQISTEVINKVKDQLGREPRGMISIVATTPNGDPQVVKCEPVVDGKPFPTLYWLTDPALSKFISSIEANQFVKKLENIIIPNSKSLQIKMLIAAKEYQRERLKLLLSISDELDYPDYFFDVLSNTGVGGIQDLKRVRCLHMHYAHHLATYNPIGEIIQKEFPKIKTLTQF